MMLCNKITPAFKFNQYENIYNHYRFYDVMLGIILSIINNLNKFAFEIVTIYGKFDYWNFFFVEGNLEFKRIFNPCERTQIKVIISPKKRSK